MMLHKLNINGILVFGKAVIVFDFTKACTMKELFHKRKSLFLLS